MNIVPPARIRNVALVGHTGAGKTSLAEALLFCAGATTRLGRVDDGTSSLDTDPEELRRRQSLSLAVASLTHQDHRINLLVAPGYADFEADMTSALAMADLAVVVVSAPDGIGVQTEAAWEEAEARGLPRMIFVNKLDRERADFDTTLNSLRTRFGAGVAPLELPIGAEKGFYGVADLLSDTAFTYNGSGRASAGPIPEEMAEQEHRVHDHLVEGIVVADDALTERYLEGDPISPVELEATLAVGVAQASVFPVVCGSAATLIGIDRLADFICEVGPAPTHRPTLVAAGGETMAVDPDPEGPPLLQVFRTVSDPYVGRVSWVKALSGTVRGDAVLVNPRTSADERLHGLSRPRGRTSEPVSALVAGDIAAVTKLGALTGDTLAPRGTPVVIPRAPTPEPVLAVAISPLTKGDDDKLMSALARLTEEDPVLRVHRDDETHQTKLAGMGETHLAVSLERLARKFGVAVQTEDVKVAYRETITAPAAAEGKYKKQSGGHGQFGVASIRVEPLARGGGFEFADQIVGGAIPRQFIPAVERGVTEAMAAGGHLGYPVTDLRVVLVDGRFHPVDSSEMSFRMAGALALREALAKAGPVVLEPINRIEVNVPVGSAGDVMGDLSARRGRVSGTEAQPGARQKISALVPTAELARYGVDLRSLSGGRGRFRTWFDHYDVAPAAVAGRLADRLANHPG
ncbi:MAG: elongation factor G [Acidimicrobiales bacterium]